MLLWEALRGAGAVPVGEEAQEVLRIEAGLARWPVDMGERSLVHELRMVEHYCAFDKGCYIGQEVINRIDVMGQVNKKLYGLQLGIDGIPPSGAEVLLGDTVVGTVCSGAREGSRVRVLAILRKAAWKDGLEVQIRAGERVAPATVSELPFP
jgi:folate-binding protein YgfZ